MSPRSITNDDKQSGMYYNTEKRFVFAKGEGMVRTTQVDSFSIKSIRYDRHHESVFARGCGLNYIMYLKRGIAKITSGDEIFNLKPEDILFIPRGSVYSTSFDGEPEILFGSYAYMNFPCVPMHNHGMQMVNKTEKIEELIQLISAS